jgi:hypothetical protein
MTYDIIGKLSNPSVKSKEDLIKYLITRAKQGKSNESFSTAIKNHLLGKEQFSYLSSYCLVGPKYALGCLLGHFLYHYISEPNSTKQISLLISLLEYVQAFKFSKAALLKKTTTAKLINIVESYGIPTYFLRTSDNRPLRIYYIPYERTDFNAAYYPHLNSIALYRPKEDNSPEYVFLHEIGHLFTYNLTGEPEKVPDSFIEFNKKNNPTWKGDLVEVFVDLFSLALMAETEFSTKNPFIPKIPVTNQRLVKEYFIGLISDLKYAKSPVSSLFQDDNF